jgi:hypothetical protein
VALARVAVGGFTGTDDRVVNPEPERRGCEIRLRAERKAGELIKGREKVQGKRTDLLTQETQVDNKPTLSDMA